MTNPKLSKNIYLEKFLSVVQADHYVTSKPCLINTRIKMTIKIIIIIIIIIIRQHHVLSTCTQAIHYLLIPIPRDITTVNHPESSGRRNFRISEINIENTHVSSQQIH
jgi:hypothetical protein